METISATTSLLVLCAAALATAGCNRTGESTTDTTAAQSNSAPNPESSVMVRGSVVSVSPTQIVIKSDTGNVTVAVTQPFHLYARVPSDLSHVQQQSFIGVTSVKEPDGSEQATEIHVFPEELRGMGEGSRMMAPSASASRMTNGSVSTSRMTNGTAAQSRMSNGSVSSTSGTSLVVQYAGGSQNVTVPPNTPVTELKASSKTLAVGDRVAVVAKRGPDGTLTSDKAISTAR
jgi:hypothetical protein